MQITRALFDKMTLLWATSAPLQAIADAQPMFQTISADFTPGLDLTAAQLTLDTAGYVVNQQKGNPEDTEHSKDPLTDESLVLQIWSDGFKPWFESGGGAVGRTVFGIAMISQADGSLLATYKFPNPIVFTATQQLVLIPLIQFRVKPTIVR